MAGKSPAAGSSRAGLVRHPSLPGGRRTTEYIEALRGFNSCLQRQVNETVQITSSKVDIVMNSKGEFHQASIVRVTVATGLKLEQGGRRKWREGAGGGQDGPETEEFGEGGAQEGPGAGELEEGGGADSQEPRTAL